MLRVLLVLLAILLPSAAHAAWKEATSRNFVVYSEGSEAQLREFTTKLEKFDFLLRTVHNIRPRAPDVPKLRVYLLRNVDAVGASVGSAGVAGFYVGPVRGPVMVGTRGTGGLESYNISPEAIMLHEYAHHFMHYNFPATYPVWYSEGFAEFWGQTRILEGDVIEVGHVARNRYASFEGNRWMHVRNMLNARSYADAGNNLDLIYAQGWLLMRYLFDNRERRGQLESYLNAINRGQPYEEAVNAAFGPGADALNSELSAFAGRNRHMVLRLPFRPIDVGQITVRTLGEAEDAIVPLRIRMARGILQRELSERLAEARRLAARFPNDPEVLVTLADMENLAGNHAETRAASERLLTITPRHPRGRMFKGLAAARVLRSASSTDQAAWDAARNEILAAHRLDPNDAMILAAYYEAFALQGVLPPPGAQNGLFRALELAPADDDLRYRLARDFEQRDMIQEAIAVISPAARRLRHGDNETERERRRREAEEERWREAGQERRETAREMLARLEQKLQQRPAAVATPAT